MLRWLAVALLAVAALVAAILAAGALANLFERSPDSPRITYLVVGLPALLVALAAAWAAVRLARRR